MQTAAGTIRNEHGQGGEVVLRGANLGGWLLFEAWMNPMDSSGLKDDFSARETLAKRFGAEGCDRLLAAYEDAWITEADFDNLARQGFNAVRLPFWYRNLQNENGAWREDAFRRLDWAVAQAWKRGLYTILDFHGLPGGQSDGDSTGRQRKQGDGVEPDFWRNPAQLVRTAEIWRRVAAHFRDSAAVAAYDLINEPTGAPDRDTLWRVYDELYRAVRAVDAGHIVSVEGCWGGWTDGKYLGWGWESLPPPARFGWTNVLYQFHMYQWAWNDVAKQRGTIDEQVHAWEAHRAWGVPCYVGEFNCFAPEEAWRYAAEQFAAHGMSWTLWSYKATHGTGSDSWGLYNPRDPLPPKPNLATDSADEIVRKWQAWTTPGAFALNPLLARTVGTGRWGGGPDKP